MSKHYEEHGYRYNKTLKGWFTVAYKGMVQRSKNKGWEVEFTKEEFSKWAVSQPNFKELMDDWEMFDYQTKHIPTPDRLHDSKCYTFDNLQLLSLEDNRAKQILTQCNKIYQLQNGKVVGVFDSMREASRKTRVHLTGISNCCKGKQELSGGFAWSNKLKGVHNEL